MSDEPIGAGVRAAWRLGTPATRAGAIALLQVRGDVEGALAGLGVPTVPVGAISLRNLAGIDRGLVARVRPDLALLMPHGGVEVVRRLSAALREAGVAEERDGDAGSAFPEASSGLEARMLATLARAASPRAVDLLLDQPRRWGAWGMPDPPADAPAPDAEHSRLLGRLVDPPLIVAVGRSNIGKSTLLNRLAGRTVAAVAHEPGTTRDHVGALVEIDGLVARYVDTPGIRPGAGAIEREAWALVEALLPAADLVLALGDAGSPPVGAPSGVPVVRVALRADLGGAAWAHEAEVSALTGDGIGELAVLLRRTLAPDWALASELPWRFWDCPGPTIAAGRSDPGV